MVYSRGIGAVSASNHRLRMSSFSVRFYKNILAKTLKKSTWTPNETVTFYLINLMDSFILSSSGRNLRDTQIIFTAKFSEKQKKAKPKRLISRSLFHLSLNSKTSSWTYFSLRWRSVRIHARFFPLNDLDHDVLGIKINAPLVPI